MSIDTSKKVVYNNAVKDTGGKNMAKKKKLVEVEKEAKEKEAEIACRKFDLEISGQRSQIGLQDS